MPTVSQPSSAPTLDPKPEQCFTCSSLEDHDRAWISKGPEKRHLVLCFDGTGDSFDQDNSNIVQLLAMLRKDDPAKQLVYYQAGIGTYTSSVVKTPILEDISKLWDEMIAYDLPDHTKEGYLFLMQNYRAGDQICIFGFSRGAYTARALAGMVQRVGLLPHCNIEQLPFAYDLYVKDDLESRRVCTQFKQTFSINATIKFLGVWDTVESAGLFQRSAPFSRSNDAIVHFRHALALDEHRVKFMPSFSTNGERASREPSEDEHGINVMTGPETNEEVFFAGAHCDIGGGSVKNGTHHSLARIPLRWMIRECFKAEVGIIFDAHMLKYVVGLDTDSITKAPKRLEPGSKPLKGPDDTELKGPSFLHVPIAIISVLTSPFRWIWSALDGLLVHDSSQAVYSPNINEPRPPFEGEAQETLEDALSPIYDELKKRTHWKVMECLWWFLKKTRAEVEGSGDFWAYKIVWNLWKGRKVYKQVMDRGMKVHSSVRTRMLAEGGKDSPYLPEVRCVMEDGTRQPTRKEWLANEPTFFKWVD